MTAAVDAVEFEYGIFHHGIDLFRDDECARNIVADFDSEASLGWDALWDVSDHEERAGCWFNQ